MLRKTILSLIILAVILTSCQPGAQSAGQKVTSANTAAVQTAATKVNTPADAEMQSASPTEAPAEAPTLVPAPSEAVVPEVPATVSESQPPTDAAPASSGPDSFATGINPLSGLPVTNPSSLKQPPALISITQFPISARPQAGLSFSPIVFELYIGEGMTRYLALFYGDYPVVPASSAKLPEGAANGSGTSQDAASTSNPKVGPIRSGRLPYEKLRKLYNGFLVMASAYKDIAARLNYATSIYGSDGSDINSALIDVTKLSDVAAAEQKRLGSPTITGMSFDSAAPAGGQAANKIWMPWSFLNQVWWKYNPDVGAYQRYQDQADGKTFKLQSDRLTGQPLNFQNVIFLLADHHARYETVIDIDLMYITRMPALLFRDGKMYNIFWTTANDTYEKTTSKLRPIRFIDASGKPFPLKPGHTMIELVNRNTLFDEVKDTDVYYYLTHSSQPGSGVWAVRYAPAPVENP